MPEPGHLTPMQVLNRFARDHKDETTDLILSAETVRELVGAITHGMSALDGMYEVICRLAGQEPPVLTDALRYGEESTRG